MRIGVSAVLALGIGLLAGCHGAHVTKEEPLAGKQFPTNPTVTKCSAANCAVSVTIAFTPPPNFSCTITVDPPIVDLSEGPSPKTITWTITNPNFVWPPWTGMFLPIAFEGNAAESFSNPTISTTSNSVSVTYTRPSVVGNRYGYGANVRHKILSRICSRDPWFVD